MKPKGSPYNEKDKKEKDFPGYPHHGAKEDIYANEKELENVKPDPPYEKKAENEDAEIQPQEPAEFIDKGKNKPGEHTKPKPDDFEDDDAEPTDIVKDDMGLVDDADDLDVQPTEDAVSHGKGAGEAGCARR